MTQQVNDKIAELASIKSNLIRKEHLINPTNTSLFYSTKATETLGSTEGVNPIAICSVMTIIEDTILGYIEELKGLPFIRTSPVLTQKTKTMIAIENGVNHNTSLLKQKGEDLSIQDILPILDDITLISAVEGLKFTTNTTVESEDRNTTLNYEIILYKINSSNNDITTFRSGQGDLNVTIGKNDINVDDIYILGILFNNEINPNLPYYVDLSFVVSKTTVIAGSTEIRGTIGNLDIGLQNLDVDTSLSNSILLTSIFGFNDIGTRVESAESTTVDFTFGGVPYSPTGQYSGNVMVKIGTRGRLVNIADKKISLWQNSSSSSSLHSGTYDLFELENVQQDRIIFNNLRPIDIVIEEAIDGL
jgi:hypothetical protein